MKVLIENPPVNSEYDRLNLTYLRRYSSHEYNSPTFQRLFDQDVAPQTHPRVLELGAGDGPAAEFCIGKGWIPTNIICLDKVKSLTPLVAGVSWKYVNLLRLNEALEGEVIPGDIADMRGVFDIVFADQIDDPRLPKSALNRITQFFVRKDGRVFDLYSI